MGRTTISRVNPQRRMVKLVAAHKSTVSQFFPNPKLGEDLVMWMAPGKGAAGPFVFRVDSLVGDHVQFEIAVLESAQRTTRLFSGRQGAGALNQIVEIAAGDRIVISLKEIAKRSAADQTEAKGVWISFVWTMTQESQTPEGDLNA